MNYYCPLCGRRASSVRYSPYGRARRPTRCSNRRCDYDPDDGAVFLTKAELALRAELEREANYVFRPQTADEGVQISRGSYSTAPYREQIETRGALHKCHTCGSDAAKDPDQPWIGDHVPSTGLSSSMEKAVRSAKSIAGGETYLFPHCYACSTKQADMVKKYASARSLDDVPEGDRKYLVGTQDVSVAHCILATGPKVSSTQGKEIQKLGIANGCHCCGERFPAPFYIADHVFPKEMCTSYMEGLFRKLGLRYPSKFYLMAQCVRCSTNQGGTLSSLAGRAQAMARGLGVTVYK